ncbi:hypothetical protein D3C80_1734210 [compost metagenome]
MRAIGSDEDAATVDETNLGRTAGSDEDFKVLDRQDGTPPRLLQPPTPGFQNKTIRRVSTRRLDDQVAAV